MEPKEMYLAAERDLAEAQAALDALVPPVDPEVRAAAKANYDRAERQMFLMQKYADQATSEVTFPPISFLR